MKHLACIVLAACGGGETATTDSLADTTAAAAPAPAALTAQDLAGTFNGSSYREGADTAVGTWTMVTSVGADNAVTSKLIFTGATDSIPVRLVAIEGDSVRWEMGPYKLGGKGEDGGAAVVHERYLLERERTRHCGVAIWVGGLMALLFSRSASVQQELAASTSANVPGGRRCSTLCCC